MTWFFHLSWSQISYLQTVGSTCVIASRYCWDSRLEKFCTHVRFQFVLSGPFFFHDSQQRGKGLFSWERRLSAGRSAQAQPRHPLVTMLDSIQVTRAPRDMHFLDPPWAREWVQSLVFCLSFSQLGKQLSTVCSFSGLDKPWAALEGGGEERRQEETLPVKLGFDWIASSCLEIQSSFELEFAISHILGRQRAPAQSWQSGGIIPFQEPHSWYGRSWRPANASFHLPRENGVSWTSALRDPTDILLSGSGEKVISFYLLSLELRDSLISLLYTVIEFSNAWLPHPNQQNLTSGWHSLTHELINSTNGYSVPTMGSRHLKNSGQNEQNTCSPWSSPPTLSQPTEVRTKSVREKGLDHKSEDPGLRERESFAM